MAKRWQQVTGRTITEAYGLTEASPGVCANPLDAPWNGTIGPAGAALTSLFTTTGGAKNISICASIPASQYPAAGSYSDTVTMTISY